jgi:hypothetical protein
VSVVGRTVLALAIAAVGLVGLSSVATRLAGEVSATAWLVATVAAAAGYGAFFGLQYLARQPWARDSFLVARGKGWLFVAALVTVPFWADLGRAAQLALTAAGGGYLAAVLAYVARRLLTVRAARATPRRDASEA